MDGKVEIFCYLLMEEFLMRKNLTQTLNQFREEWITRPDEVVHLLLYQLILLGHNKSIVDGYITKITFT